MNLKADFLKIINFMARLLPPWEGRALRNCPVGNFSVGASLQGRLGRG